MKHPGHKGIIQETVAAIKINHFSFIRAKEFFFLQLYKQTMELNLILIFECFNLYSDRFCIENDNNNNKHLPP